MTIFRIQDFSRKCRVFTGIRTRTRIRIRTRTRIIINFFTVNLFNNHQSTIQVYTGSRRGEGINRGKGEGAIVMLFLLVNCLFTMLIVSKCCFSMLIVCSFCCLFLNVVSPYMLIVCWLCCFYMLIVCSLCWFPY